MPEQASGTQQSSSSRSDLQGLNYLVTEAIVNITTIVESLHHRINRVSGLLGHPAKERTSGISGGVYKGVRGLAKLIGHAIDVPLAVLNRAYTKEPNSPAIKALRAALNGILGDYLVSQNNPLSIDMHLSFQGKPLNSADLDRVLERAVEENQGRLLLMIHGLCMNDLQWTKDGHDHGQMLAQELGVTPLYLNYNSGQHISFNGQQLSALLEDMIQRSPAPLSINILAHSMGGLIARSAIHFDQNHDKRWHKNVAKAVFLGTPHHGAPLEKTGNWLDLLLGTHPYTAPFTKLIQIRSRGITDLRHGNLTHKDEQPRNRFDFVRDNREPIALPDGIECYTIAGSIGTSDKFHKINVIGDGLVTVDSALGRHETKTHTLLFPTHRQAHLKAVNHLQLLGSDRVYDLLRKWLA